jgi:hypothetical protein
MPISSRLHVQYRKTSCTRCQVHVQATCNRAEGKVAEAAPEYVCTVEHTPSCVDSEFPAECREDIFTTPCLQVHFAFRRAAMRQLALPHGGSFGTVRICFCLVWPFFFKLAAPAPGRLWSLTRRGGYLEDTRPRLHMKLGFQPD